MTALAFGPSGVLFIGDSQNSTVFAVDTKDAKKSASAMTYDVKNIDSKIAEALGTTKENISISTLIKWNNNWEGITTPEILINDVTPLLSG